MSKDLIVYPLVSVNKQNQDFIIEKGEGIYLYDNNGRRYLDLNSGLWNVPFGYGISEYVSIIEQQMKNLHYVNLITMTSTPTINYAEALIKYTNNDFSRVIYTCSGSESVECAIKLARKYMHINGYPQRKRILAFDMAYHGTTYAAMTLSGMDKEDIGEYVPLVNEIELLNTPFFPKGAPDENVKKKWIDELKERFNKNDIAAVIIEPVMASGGIITLPSWYMKVLFELIKTKEVLFIADEVATGFGRTGEIFKYQEYQHKPDILCLSKAINNGIIPMGTVLINERILKGYSKLNEHINHFSTQNGNPLACATALKTLDLLDENVLMNIKQRSEQFKIELDVLKQQNDSVREIRIEGLMIAVDLVTPDNKPLGIDELDAIMKYAHAQGIIIYIFECNRKTAGIILMPPYGISSREVTRTVKIMKKIVDSI